MKKVILFCAAILIWTTMPSGVYAAPFYKGKVMKIIVATKPGGGYDYYGRLMARFMQKYLPGCTIIVKNVPGAGHIIGTNEVYASKPDGLTFGAFNRALTVAQLIGLKGVRFDLSKMSWLGSPCREVYSLIIAKRFKNLDGLMKADRVRLATSGLGTVDYLNSKLFVEMTGQKNFKVLTGYSGGEGELAMMRGEIDGEFGSWYSLESLVKNDIGVPAMFLAKKQPAGHEDVPLIQDVIKAEKYKPIVKLLYSVNLVGRPLAGPPGIPSDRLALVREAFKKACYDPELLAIAKKADKPIEYVDDKEAMEWVHDMLSMPPDVVRLVKEAYGIQ